LVVAKRGLACLMMQPMYQRAIWESTPYLSPGNRLVPTFQMDTYDVRRAPTNSTKQLPQLISRHAGHKHTMEPYRGLHSVFASIHYWV
jgi:hypothetical protein